MFGRTYGNSIPNKIKLFCWKALNEIIPTNFNLFKRGVSTTMLYPLCLKECEFTDHCLFGCFQSKEIWSQTFNQVMMEVDFNNNITDRWMLLNSKKFD